MDSADASSATSSLYGYEVEQDTEDVEPEDVTGESPNYSNSSTSVPFKVTTGVRTVPSSSTWGCALICQGLRSFRQVHKYYPNPVAIALTILGLLILVPYVAWIVPTLTLSFALFFFDGHGSVDNVSVSSVLFLFTFGGLIIFECVYQSLIALRGTFRVRITRALFRGDEPSMGWHDLDVDCAHTAKLFFETVPCLAFSVISVVIGIIFVFIEGHWQLGLTALTTVSVVILVDRLRDFHKHKTKEAFPSKDIPSFAEEKVVFERRRAAVIGLLSFVAYSLYFMSWVAFVWFGAKNVQAKRYDTLQWLFGVIFYCYTLFFTHMTTFYLDKASVETHAANFLAPLLAEKADDVVIHHEGTLPNSTPKTKWTPWILSLFVLCVGLLLATVVVIGATTRFEITCKPVTVTCSATERTATSTINVAQKFGFRDACHFVPNAQTIVTQCARALLWDGSETLSVKATFPGWRSSKGYSAIFSAGSAGGSPVQSSRSAANRIRADSLGNDEQADATDGSVEITQFQNPSTALFRPTITNVFDLSRFVPVGGELVTSQKATEPSWYRFQGKAGESIVVTLVSETLYDPVMYLYYNNQVTKNYEPVGESASNSTVIIATLPSDGQYYVQIARQFASGQAAGADAKYPFSIAVRSTVRIGSGHNLVEIAQTSSKGYYGIETSYSWSDAIALCRRDFAGQGLCSRAEICPSGAEPFFGLPTQVQFVPSSEPAAWVQVGTMDANISPAKTCEHVEGPSWSNYPGPLYFRGAVACCDRTFGKLPLNSWFVFRATATTASYTIYLTPLSSGTMTFALFDTDANKIASATAPELAITQTLTVPDGQDVLETYFIIGVTGEAGEFAVGVVA